MNHGQKSVLALTMLLTTVTAAMAQQDTLRGGEPRPDVGDNQLSISLNLLGHG